MHKLACLIVAAAVLSACAKAPESELSCAELADTRADSQLRQNLDSLEDQEIGLPEKSEVQRKLYEIDAKSYREQLYRECLRRRGETPAQDAND
jgi:hypothetical protein